MQVSVLFSSQEETQKMMHFLQQYYGAIKDMEKYSIDAEKSVTFLSGEPSGIMSNFRGQIITSRWEASMPLQALYLYCWMAVKSSYRNNNNSPVVFVDNQEFELCFNYSTLQDTQKILVDPIGLCINDESNSILSYFMGGTKGIFNLFNKKLQQRHIENIEETMNALDRQFQRA